MLSAQMRETIDFLLSHNYRHLEVKGIFSHYKNIYVIRYYNVTTNLPTLFQSQRYFQHLQYLTYFLSYYL